MSAFRAITAEEEAATALIQALKRQNYPGSKRLRPWSHIDKNAFWPLVVAVNNAMSKSGIAAPNVGLSRTGKPKVSLRINLTALAGGSGEAVWAQPDHPLNFAIRTGDAAERVIHFFEAELAQLAGTSGEGSILDYIKKQANTRNLLLYAADDGIPEVSFDDDMLRERARRVCVLVILAIIVVQTPTHQLFVTQCLEALLRAMEVANEGLIDLAELDTPPERPLVRIERIGTGPGRISVRRQIDVRLSWGRAAPNWRWSEPPSVRATIDPCDSFLKS